MRNGRRLLHRHVHDGQRRRPELGGWRIHALLPHHGIAVRSQFGLLRRHVSRRHPAVSVNAKRHRMRVTRACLDVFPVDFFRVEPHAEEAS